MTATQIESCSKQGNPLRNTPAPTIASDSAIATIANTTNNRSTFATLLLILLSSQYYS